MFSSSSLEDLSNLDPTLHPSPLRKAASLDNLFSAYSVKASLLSTPSPLTRLLTYYSLHLAPSAYLLFLRETANLIQRAPSSVQNGFIDHLIYGGQLYSDIIKDYPSSEWLVRSLVQELIQDPSGKTNPITLQHFSNHWTNLSQCYPRDQQIELLNALWEAKKSANLTLLQLTHILEIVSVTGQIGYDMVCREQPDKVIYLKHYWLSDQVNNLPQFASSPEACSQLTDALSRTHLSPSFIPNLLLSIGEEDDLPSLLGFLELISKRKVPELIVSSIIYEKASPIALSKSKAYQWLTSLRCELSLMHLSKIDSNASDSIAPILYNRIKQDPAIAKSLEDFVYTCNKSIVKYPSTFIELLEFIYNYQIKEEITDSVFKQLAEEAPSQWIAKAGQLITDKLSQSGQPYSVEALIEKIFEPGPVMLYTCHSQGHTLPSSHYLKKTTIEKILTQQVVENLKPVIKDQLVSVINGYEKELAILETRARTLREDIKKVEEKRSDLSTCFNIKKQAYKNRSAALKVEEKALSIEIDKLEKENEENLKKSEKAVKKLEEKLGKKAEEDAATPPPVPTNQSEEPSKLAQLQGNLSTLSKTRSNLKTSYKVKKESYEASSAALLKQIKILEVDLLKLEQNQKPIRLKIQYLSQEDATNFSDYSLYKEVLDNLSKLKPILRTSDNKPLDPCRRSALTTWSKEIKHKGSSLFGTHSISEIITGINQAATLSNSTHLTKSQYLDLLSALFPFYKQSKIQRSKDPLVIIFLAAICALQNGQVSLVTDSKEWPISESAISSYLPLFKILDLTATKRDSMDPSSSCKSNIVYGKRSDFLAIPRIMDYNILQQKQQSIDNCYHSPSCLLQSADTVSFYGFKYDPISKWNKKAVGQWAGYVQHHLPKLASQETLLMELIAVTEHAATLIQGAPLTPDQCYGLLTLLYPSLDRGQLLQKAQKDHLVAAMFTAIRSLQAQQSHVTLSQRLADVREHQPLFDLLNLTISSKKSAAASERVSVMSPTTPLGASTLSTLLRLAASAPVTWHQVEAHYNRIGSMQKEEKELKTLKDATNQNVDLSDINALKPISASNYEVLIQDKNKIIDSIQEPTDPPHVAVEEPSTPSAAYEQLKKQYDSIEASYQSPSRMLQSSALLFKEKPISQWNKGEIKEWATYVQSNYQPGLEIELIAGVQHAVKLHYPFSPRPTQLLALLMLLHPAYDKGRLAQINTGEGKSLIVAMLAAIHGLQGKQVDVITTSTELSIPEVKEKSTFFQLLNLSVSENSPSSNKVAVYNSQIVYGTASDFQADILRQEFLGENTRGNRGYDIVLVDEVDSLLFDNRSHSVRLGLSHPGMDHLKLPLGTIWHHMQWIKDHMFEYKGTVYFTAKDSISPDTDITTDKSIIPIKEDKRAFITRMTKVYLEKLLRNLDSTEAQEYKEHFEKRSEIAQAEQKIKSIKDEGGTAQEDIQRRDKLAEELHNLPWSQRAPILDIPDHLRQFSRIQLPSWIKNCLSALFDYEIKKHYIVSGDNRIVPVQYNETGILQHNLVWSNGLCQFLQMKERLSVDPESISTNYFSNIGFFKRYGNSIYGLTGTLGESATRSFLEELYGVDFVVIPPYQRTKIQDNSHTPYLCKELRPILVEEKDWFPAILYHLLHHAKQGRAVLAICQCIRACRIPRDATQSPL
ncbi:hypothetical protein [Cardinium endosymbiont of Nabis limbatus]|uniref:hypothetical protein n=1 Tax=Cardinium endosymbiont of Nabis limbatus TaxID=3066217 RepID=UPI003AF3879C